MYTAKIGKKVVKPTTQWFVNGKWAGTRTVYARNLTYTTIAGVGHMTPEWAPRATAEAIIKFILDVDLTEDLKN